MTRPTIDRLNELTRMLLNQAATHTRKPVEFHIAANLIPLGYDPQKPLRLHGFPVYYDTSLPKNVMRVQATDGPIVVTRYEDQATDTETTAVFNRLTSVAEKAKADGVALRCFYVARDIWPDGWDEKVDRQVFGIPVYVSNMLPGGFIRAINTDEVTAYCESLDGVEPLDETVRRLAKESVERAEKNAELEEQLAATRASREQVDRLAKNMAEQLDAMRHKRDEVVDKYVVLAASYAEASERHERRNDLADAMAMTFGVDPAKPGDDRTVRFRFEWGNGEVVEEHVKKWTPHDYGRAADASFRFLNGRLYGDGAAPQHKYEGLTPRLDDARVNAVLSGIRNELARARKKFPGDNVTMLALMEEVGELATALFEEPAENVREEAIQVAVMAIRVILDGDATLDDWREKKGLDMLGADDDDE